MKVIINGKIKEIDDPDLFIKENDIWYVRTKNVDREILNDLEIWLEERFCDGDVQINPYIYTTLKLVEKKLDELKEKHK